MAVCNVARQLTLVGGWLCKQMELDEDAELGGAAPPTPPRQPTADAVFKATSRHYRSGAINESTSLKAARVAISKSLGVEATVLKTPASKQAMLDAISQCMGEVR